MQAIALGVAGAALVRSRDCTATVRGPWVWVPTPLTGPTRQVPDPYRPTLHCDTGSPDARTRRSRAGWGPAPPPPWRRGRAPPGAAVGGLRRRLGAAGIQVGLLVGWLAGGSRARRPFLNPNPAKLSSKRACWRLNKGPRTPTHSLPFASVTADGGADGARRGGVARALWGVVTAPARAMVRMAQFMFGWMSHFMFGWRWSSLPVPAPQSGWGVRV